MVQWLRLQAPNAGAGSIPGQESRSLMLQLTILHAATKKKKKMICHAAAKNKDGRSPMPQLRPSAAK